jgi:hypothetical protein
MLRFGIGSSVASVAIILFMALSVRARDTSQSRMRMQLRQQNVMSQLRTNGAEYDQNLKSLGISDLSAWETFSAASLNKLFRKLQIDHHLADCRYSITHSGALPPDLFSITLTLDMKSNRDRNIIGFLQQFATCVPGIVVFERVQIEREGKILSHDEFVQLLKGKGKNKKIPPAFSAKVQCKLVVPMDLAKQFSS